MLHVLQEQELHVAQRVAVEARPLREVVDAVVDPVQVRPHLGQVGRDRRGRDDGLGRIRGIEQVLQRAQEEAQVELALEARLETRPVNRRMNREIAR